MKSDPKTEEHNQCPKRVSTVLGNEFGERKQARPPQQTSPDNQRGSQGVSRTTPVNSDRCCGH